MKARLVIEAEASIPQAIADTLQEDGNMGILDYYTLKNISSDTEMKIILTAEPPKAGNKHWGLEALKWKP